jgi:hypothetical protein
MPGKVAAYASQKLLRETTMDSKSSDAPRYRPKRAAFNWVDLLVIAATVLTFLVVVVASKPTARPLPHLSSLTRDLPAQHERVSSALAVIGAKIRLATGEPWG